MTKKEGKTSQLIFIDKDLWKQFSSLRQPFGTVNELFEDYIRILLAKEPKHYEILNRLKEVLPLLSQNIPIKGD